MDARRAQESWSYLPICLFDTSSAHHAAAGAAACPAESGPRKHGDTGARLYT